VPAAEPSAVSRAEAARLFADLAEAPVLVLAVSGGPDSTALLLLAARWRAALKAGPQLIAVTVDHGLRAEAAYEAAAVGRLAAELGVVHRIVNWPGPKPDTGLQAAARAARYRVLGTAAQQAGASHILTAHTLDDQAETVLMRLARGSGLTGLAAMARLTPLGRGITLVRPLLDTPKARLIATLDEAGIDYARDPSNENTRFTRARLRALMPALAAEGLDTARLAQFAGRAARADAALEAAAHDAFGRLRLNAQRGDGLFAFAAPGFRALPREIALRVLGRAVAQVGDEGRVELGKLESLLQALDASGPPRLRRTLAGACVTLHGGRLTIERAPARRRVARTDVAAFSERPAQPFGGGAFVKEYGRIPLAAGVCGPTLAPRGRELPRLAGTFPAAELPASRKGRK
jgi:tRNA(Ile)-lysidine synthase